MAGGFEPKSLDDILAGAPGRRARGYGWDPERGPKPLWAVVGGETPYGAERRTWDRRDESPATGIRFAQAAPSEQGKESAGAGSGQAEPQLVTVDLPGMGPTYVDATIAPNLRRWIELNEKAGISLTFNEGFRTNKDQVDMRLNPKAITPAKPGMSLHEAGRAIDANVGRLSDEQVQTVVRNAEEAGFSWGGRFRKPDRPHFFIESPGGIEKRREYIKRMQDIYRQLQAAQAPRP